MSIIAMRVVRIDDHPNADTLRVLRFEAPGIEGLVVVANQEGEYAPGDVLAVARVGATLRDGTKIRRARLRGLDSHGMIVGPTDAEIGTDLNAEHGQIEVPLPSAPARPEGAKMAKWASIEGLPAVRKGVRMQVRLDPGAIIAPTLGYRAKIKLDGTNAGVQVFGEGKVVAQSRTRLITPEKDNYGFAAWVHGSAAEFFGGLFERHGRVLVYGEWCGPGIQKKVAITSIERKIFAVFAIVLGDPNEADARLVVDPDRIRAMLPEHPDVRVLPWHGETVSLDFHSDSGLERGAAKINEMVSAVEQVDPWVQAEFGVEGVGEGVVLYPIDGVDFDERGSTERDAYFELMFKAKGEAHRVNKQSKAVRVDPQVSASTAAFVDQFVTVPRLEQGVTEACEGEFDMRRMGDFLKWLGRDVKKESVLELEASNLEWKNVAKAVAHAGQRWYRGKVAGL
ncbi:MAG: RNA ligase family protein [Myxococcota bacterium]